MATWDEVRALARASADAIEDGEELVTALLPIRIDGRDVRVAIHLRLGSGANRTWLAAAAYVADEHVLAPRDMLEHNRRLAAGALCLDEDGYWLRHTLPLARASAGDVAAVIALVAHEAARLRMLATPLPCDDPGLFEAYAA